MTWTSWPSSMKTTVVPVSWQSGTISRSAMSKFSMSSTRICLRQRRLLGRLGAAQAVADVLRQDVRRLDAQLRQLVADLIDVDLSHVAPR